MVQIYIVSKNHGLVEWLNYHKRINGEVIDCLKEDHIAGFQEGDIVIGDLTIPQAIATLARRTEVYLIGYADPPERPTDLTAAQLNRAGARLMRFGLLQQTTEGTQFVLGLESRPSPDVRFSQLVLQIVREIYPCKHCSTMEPHPGSYCQKQRGRPCSCPSCPYV